MSRTNLPGTNLGPLTTTWTMPETCTLFIPPCSTCTEGFRGQSCNAASKGSPRDNTACWPPAKPGVTSPAWPFVGWGFYSPGLACPSGYMSACTAVYNQRPDWDTQFKLYEGETAVGCCPPGFACTNLNGNTCMLTVTQRTTVPTAQCDATDVTKVATRTFPDDLDSYALSSTLPDGTKTWYNPTVTLYAPMFQLNFRASDLSTSTPTSTSPRKTDGATQTNTPPSTGTKPKKSKKNKGTLSGGAKAGIGIGVALGAVAIIGSAIMLFLRRRKQSKGESAELAADELKALPVDTRSEAHEMPGSLVAELPADVDGVRRGAVQGNV